MWNLRPQLGIVSADMQQGFSRRTPKVEIILSGFYSSLDIDDHQAINLCQRTRGSEMMEKLGIWHLRERPFGEMSTGEQGRALPGRALAHEPHALVLDEPKTGLDVQACFQYLAIIRKFIQESGTVILVTHHVHEIPPKVRQVVLLKQARIVEDGSKEEVLNNDSLSGLFDTPLKLFHNEGWYQVVAASSNGQTILSNQRVRHLQDHTLKKENVHG